MSELTLFLIRLAYLAILWIFVLSAISVIRSDMFGARMPAAAPRGRRAEQQASSRQPKPAKARRGAPTHVAGRRRRQRRASAPTSPTRRS